MPAHAATVIHLSPHPDDEVIGAPATLLGLGAAGWRVVNVALSLGRPEQRDRREGELRQACQRAGFDLVIPEIARTMSSLSDGTDDTEAAVASAVADVIATLTPELVISPTPHDRHPGHEVVGRAAAAALTAREIAPRWWQWGLWADLPFPTIVTAFGTTTMEQIIHALSAHAGELERNPYQHLVTARATQNSILGPERVFNFGTEKKCEEPFAEVLTEVQRDQGRWLLGTPRVFDAAAVLVPVSNQDVSEWLSAPSLSRRYGRPGVNNAGASAAPH